MLLAFAAPASAASGQRIDSVRIDGFHTTEAAMCRPSDVDLDTAQVRAFFQRGRQVEHRTIHDHYPVAPCYIEGTLRRGGARCDWVIRAGATGHVSCGKQTRYYVCDACDDLFVPAERQHDTP